MIKEDKEIIKKERQISIRKRKREKENINKEITYLKYRRESYNAQSNK